jgi:hypothetical protein
LLQRSDPKRKRERERETDRKIDIVRIEKIDYSTVEE